MRERLARGRELALDSGVRIASLERDVAMLETLWSAVAPVLGTTGAPEMVAARVGEMRDRVSELEDELAEAGLARAFGPASELLAARDRGFVEQVQRSLLGQIRGFSAVLGRVRAEARRRNADREELVTALERAEDETERLPEVLDPRLRLHRGLRDSGAPTLLRAPIGTGRLVPEGRVPAHDCPSEGELRDEHTHLLGGLSARLVCVALDNYGHEVGDPGVRGDVVLALLRDCEEGDEGEHTAPELCVFAAEVLRDVREDVRVEERELPAVRRVHRDVRREYEGDVAQRRVRERAHEEREHVLRVR